jgi:DNA-binding MarR family transcriptional regulator
MQIIETASKNNSNHNNYFHIISQLIRKLKLLDKDQKICYGLTMQQCYTIETLGQKNPQTMNALSQLLGVSISTMTRVVNILVRDGIVERVTTPEDRRKVWVELTTVGNDLEVKLKKCSYDYINELMTHIPSDKRGILLESLELINNAIDKVNKRCCLKK